MQTTINVTLGGKVFHVEEPAYLKLKTYLDELRKRFATHEDGGEIVEDIEQAIAGHMVERLHPGKEAITETDVAEMIAQMGGVDELTGSAPKQETESVEAAGASTKRLFRDMDEGMLGGVSAGLAAYLNIDVTLIRVIFIVATLLGAWGLVIYLLLWVLVPEAKTVNEKMMMSGAPLTVDSIEESARAMFARAKAMSPKRRQIDDAVAGIGRLLRGLLAIGQAVLGIVLVLGAAIGMVAAMIMGVVAFFRTAFVLNADPVIQGIFALVHPKFVAVAGWAFVMVPLAIAMTLGVSLLRKRNVFRPIPVFAGVGIWIIAASALAMTTIDVLPEVERLQKEDAESRLMQTHQLDFADFSNVDISTNGSVKLRSGETFMVSVSADDVAYGEMRVEQSADTLVITRDCVFTCDRPTDVTIVLPQLNTLAVRGTGYITLEGFEQSAMALDVQGVVHVDAEGAIDLLTIGAVGPVDVDASRLVADAIALDVLGSGEWDLQTARVTGSATGDATFTFHGEHAGSVDVDDFEMKGFVRLNGAQSME